MERFIARENIKRFRQQLETCTDQVQRLTLEKLLAAEEAKLEALGLSSATKISCGFPYEQNASSPQ